MWKIDSVRDVSMYTPNGELLKFADSAITDIDVPLSNKEDFPLHLNMQQSASFEASTPSSLYECIQPPSNKYSLMCDIPIMIQARWHKKSKVRKKWLKRYGMRSDFIKMKYDVDEVTMTPCEYDTYNFDLAVNGFQCILRPDQLRRGIKICIR